MTSPRPLLIVDDDDTLRTQLVRAFSRRGISALGAADHAAAMHLARAHRPERAVIDLRMPPGPSGLVLLRDLIALDATIRVVVLTGYGSIATAIKAIRAGAVQYLPKPADADEILAAFTGEASSPRGDAALAPPTPSLARAEWEHIQRVLADCDGNVSRAAQRLGVHRRTLQRKLQKYPPPQ
jgi:two-component system response regulator RegA